MSHTATRHELDSKPPEVIHSPNGEQLAVRFDVTGLLETNVGPNWQEALRDAVDEHGVWVERSEDHPTLREADPEAAFRLLTLYGDKLAEIVPGIWDLYRTGFKRFMEESLLLGATELKAYDTPLEALETVSQEVATAANARFQNRMEAHVDQRYTAVLALEVPELDTEGRLVISNDPAAMTVEEIDKDATRIVHVPGTLVCFSQGGKFPHYTEEIKKPGSRRIVLALNYPKVTETAAEARALTQRVLGLGSDEPLATIG